MENPMLVLRKNAVLAAVVSLSALTAWSAAAQSYPVKPVRVVVPAAAGGPTDIPGRIIADALRNSMGQAFVVENRVGAGGIIGAEQVWRADPNGYTLLYANTSVVSVNPALYGAKLPYDAPKFTYIGFVSESAQVLVANPKLPYKTFQEMIAFAKANPTKINFASGGVGTLPHLSMELLQLETGIKTTLINYSGGGPALVAVVAGQSDLLFDLLSARVRDGSARPLAVTGRTRLAEIPDVPTVAELGLPEMLTSSGTGVVGPAGVPRDVVTALNTRLNEALASPEVRAKMQGLGLTPRSGPSSDFENWATDQRQKWIRVVKAANVKPEN
jgi:tripartite-type tricarboxylate transporter receptor subunit TctC